MKDDDSATASPSIAPSGGLAAAALGVLAFSFTLPATALALRGFGPYTIGLGRAAIAAVLAVVALRLTRAPRPRGRQWVALAVVAVGVVFGFPVLSTLALGHGASASHAAVVVGLLPVTTAVFAVVRVGERPSWFFWTASVAGAGCVVAFTLRNGPGRLSAADLFLFGALVTAGLGYAEGGRLARTMPGGAVVSWALILAAPVTVPVTAVLIAAEPPRWSPPAVAGLAYLAAVSMFLGFFAWYSGLARAGVARASQVQLAQPLLTLVWSWLLLGEHAGMSTVTAAAGVLVCVLLAQRARVSRERTASTTGRRTVAPGAVSRRGAADG
ncbi:DMT family transporter [Actinoallomurus iriomotensis]|uniref:Membrane protein n=1 Tax=Actinoallomurus iriomotensis TaxID=478107 RepID=A0A9W6RD16_9ACTN|nr:DMT family transporter [Actinoallomurus iriomotensis]GLY72465.1 membrane protein [Actinoallomurus iriomotensis]